MPFEILFDFKQLRRRNVPKRFDSSKQSACHFKK